MSRIPIEELNTLIYMTPVTPEPTRYQIIRYSTWRIYLFQEFESLPTEKINELKKSNANWLEKFQQLVSTREEHEFYSDFLNECRTSKTSSREDIISHFICRMLYSTDSANHAKFVDMEKMVLSIRLNRRLSGTTIFRIRLMEILKRLLAFFLQKPLEQFHVPIEEWNQFNHKIIAFAAKKDDKRELTSIDEYALLPIQYAEFGLKKRFSFVNGGRVFMSIQSTIDSVINLYGLFLKGKLEKMRGPVMEMINNDVENQLSAFLRKTLDTLNTTNFDDVTINSEFKLNIKNVQTLWKRFYPPCMLNLTQKLKQFNHLKHDGRRQLWLYLKGCGMDSHDNQEYFRKHFMSKVSNSELKSHMYNIQHAYGQVGKKQAQRPKNCRNIITGTAPKKDEHHGCPFAHWRSEDLKEYLRKNYNISEQRLDEVMKEKNENRFMVACGRLFEGVTNAEGTQVIPSEITARLGKSPHEYFQAGMEMVSHNNKGNGKGTDKVADKKGLSTTADKKSIEF